MSHRASPGQSVCVLPVFAGHAKLFPSACTATPLSQPNEVKICCPPDTLLSADASAAWEAGKSGIHARVEPLHNGTLYVGDRGGVLGGALVAEVRNPHFGCD